MVHYKTYNEFLLEYQRQDISLLESMDNYFTIGFEIETEFDEAFESMEMYMSRKEQKKVSNFERNFMNFILKYGQDITYHYDETLVNGLEIVSIPFKSLKKAKDYIKLFFEDFENQEDWIFNHKTSIHVNVGVSNKEWNVVKGIIMMSDEYTFKDIEARKNSEYCKSLKNEIEKEMYSKILPKDNTIKSMEESIYLLLNSTIIKKNTHVGSNKEFGINISKVLFDHLNYIEYRHIGNSKINQGIVIDKLMYYCYITYLMTSDYKNREYYRKLSGFMERIKQKFIGESLDIKKLINGYTSNHDELKNIEKPIKVDDTDYVYVFRFTNKEEIDNILNGGTSGGFWSTNRDYPGDYILISKTNTQDYASFINVPSNRQEYFLSWNKDEPVHTKNKHYVGKPTMYNNNFYEVGRVRTLEDIIDIVDSRTGESIL